MPYMESVENGHIVGLKVMGVLVLTTYSSLHSYEL